MVSLSFAEDMSQPQSSYSLATCQAMALQRSQRLSIVELQIGVAREKIHEIQGINTPKVSADATYMVRDKHPGVKKKVRPQVASPRSVQQPQKPSQNPQQGSQSQQQIKDVSQQQESPKTIKTIAANKKATTTKLSLLVPIYDFGYVDNLVGAQKCVIEATESERDRVEQDLLLEVAEYYYRALESSKLETVVLQSIKLLKQQRDNAKDLFSVGLVTKNDVLGVEVQLASREQELIQARHNIEYSLAGLSRLTELVIKHVDQLEDIPEEPVWGLSLQDALTKVTDQHPDIRRIHASILAAEWEYNAIRAENFPEINGFVNFNSSSDTYLLHRNWLTTGVGIEIPIFDGGIVDSKLKQQKKEQQELDLHLDAAHRDINLQVTDAYLSVDAAYNKIPVAKTSIHHAEENLNIDRDLYQEGLMASDDLLNDEERLAEARSNYFQAVYNFKIAKCRLAYAIGDIQNG